MSGVRTISRLGYGGRGARQIGVPDERGAISRRAMLFVGALIVAGLTVAVLLPLASGREVERMDGLLGALLVASLLPATLVLSRPNGDLFQPLPILGVVVFVYFVGRGVLLIHANPSPSELPPNLRFDYERHIAPALGLVLAAWCAAMLAYSLPIGRAVAERLPRLSFLELGVSPTRVLAVWGTGILFKVVKIGRGTHLAFITPEQVDYDTNSFVGYLSQFEDISLFLMAALYFQGRLNRFQSGMLWFVMLPVAMGFGVITGSKSRIVTALILAMLAFHYFRRFIGVRHLLLLTLLFTFFIRPVVTNFRFLYGERQGRSTELQLDASLQTARSAAEEWQEEAGAGEGFVENSLRKTSKRLHGLDSVMVAMKMTPTFLPYIEPTLYLLLPAMAVVPRALWQGKPVMSIPGWETDYWGVRETSSSFARTHFGSLYLSFGWLGTVIGMFVLGFVWRVVAVFARRHWGLLGATSYVFVLLVMMRLENDVTAIYSMLIKLVLVLGLLCWFIGKRERTRPEVAPHRPSVR